MRLITIVTEDFLDETGTSDSDSFQRDALEMRG